MSPTETILWNSLKGKRLNGYKFRRQFGVGPFIVDFYCPKLKLAIEIDGESHFENGAEYYDRCRQTYIEKYNIKFLRFTTVDIYRNLEGVIDVISEETGRMFVKNR